MRELEIVQSSSTKVSVSSHLMHLLLLLLLLLLPTAQCTQFRSSTEGLSRECGGVRHEYSRFGTLVGRGGSRGRNLSSPLCLGYFSGSIRGRARVFNEGDW